MENKFCPQQNSKYFNVSLVVCCKKADCSPVKERCQTCLQSLIRNSLSSYSTFSFTQLCFTQFPSEDNYRQFVVSFTANCGKPDCNPYEDRMIKCCTAFQEKCEFCLRSTVINYITQINGFQTERVIVL